MPTPERLTVDEVTDRLRTRPDWGRTGAALERTVECADFPAAVALVVRIGFIAEDLGHHPDLDVRWRTVRIACTTHDADGITTLDFDLAAAIDALLTGGN